MPPRSERRHRSSRRVQYDAFISYSHAADGKLAPALQAGLHRFARRPLQLRALRVFRDGSSLTATPALWPSIEVALAESRHLLLMASPESAASVWVGREVAYWREHRPRDAVFVVLTDGEVSWSDAAGDFRWPETTALSQSLRGFFTSEPKWVDLRWARTAEDVSLANPRFRDAVADLAAPIHGRGKDELVGEDVRQHRKARRLVWTAVAGLALLAAAASGAAALAFVARNDAREQSRQATSRQLAALSAVDLDERPHRALLLAAEAADEAPTLEAHKGLFDALTRYPHLITLLWTNTEITAGPVVTHDWRRAVVGDASGRLVACMVATRRCAAPVPSGIEGRVAALAASPAEGIIAASGDSGAVVLVELASGRSRPLERRLPAAALALAFSPDGEHVAAATDRKQGAVWDVASGGLVGRFSRPVLPTQDALSGLAFDGSGDTVIMGAYTGELVLFDVVPGGPARSFQLPFDNGLTGFAVDPRTGLVATSALDAVRVSDPERGKVGRAHDPDEQMPANPELAFSPDGSLLVAAGERTVVFETGEEGVATDGAGIASATLAERGVVVEHPVFAGSRLVVSRYGESALALWSAHARPAAAQVLRIPVEMDGAQPLAAAGRGPVVAFGRTVLVWPRDGAGAPRRLSTEGDVTTLAADGETGRVAVGDATGAVHLATPGSHLRRLADHRHPLVDLEFGADGALVGLTRGGAVKRWAAGSSDVSTVVGSTMVGIRLGALAPDAVAVARLTRDGELELVGLDAPRDAELLGRFAENDLTDLAFSGDGSVLLADEIGTVHRWQTRDGRKLRRSGPLNLFEARVQGRTLAVTHEVGDPTVGIWNLESQRELARLALPSSAHDLLVLDDEERWLLTGWDDGVALWDLTVAALTARSCRAANRRLSQAEWDLYRVGEYRPVCGRRS